MAKLIKNQRYRFYVSSKSGTGTNATPYFIVEGIYTDEMITIGEAFLKVDDVLVKQPVIGSEKTEYIFIKATEIIMIMPM